MQARDQRGVLRFEDTPPWEKCFIGYIVKRVYFFPK